MTKMRSAGIANPQPQFHRLDGAPDREWFQYVPAIPDLQAPVLVIVHGIARNSAEYLFRLRREADRTGSVVIAPHFSRKAYGRYQQLLDPASGARSDRALVDILEAVGAELGLDTRRIRLAGVSGGAQFAHRFAFAFPDRIEALTLLAAGWYTLPDPELPYPLGLAGFPSSAPVAADALAGIPVNVIVGDRDRARDASLRQDPEIDRLQGRHRLARAHCWTAALAAVASPGPSLIQLPGVSHNLNPAFETLNLARRLFDCLGIETVRGETSTQETHS